MKVTTKRSLSANKNTVVVLMLCSAWKCVPAIIPGGVDTSEVPRCHLLQQMSSQWGLQKLIQGLMFMNPQSTFLTHWRWGKMFEQCFNELSSLRSVSGVNVCSKWTVGNLNFNKFAWVESRIS